ncbi:MAG: hypothetical protein E6H08_21500 [Bacteroidetes bacterium]|nr:MAG: hypothetical protein E6H08_21500 [Bacteroidota bacterium]
MEKNGKNIILKKMSTSHKYIIEDSSIVIASMNSEDLLNKSALIISEQILKQENKLLFYDCLEK